MGRTFTMQGGLAIAVCIAFGGVIAGWMLHPPTGDANALAVLNTLTGTLAAAFMQTVNYYFTSSPSSKTKDDTISNLASKVDGVSTSTKPAPVPPSIRSTS